MSLHSNARSPRAKQSATKLPESPPFAHAGCRLHGDGVVSSFCRTMPQNLAASVVKLGGARELTRMKLGLT
jgi:hypothetical protein